MFRRRSDRSHANSCLESAEMLRSVFAGALIIFGLFQGQATAGAPTIIYNNGTSQNEWLPIPGNLPPPQEILDWATSGGGVVTSFQFGYFTNAPQPIDINIRFYSGTDGNSNGTLVGEYSFTNLPGFDPTKLGHFVDHDISGQPFTLPSGAFGYSYEIMDAGTGPMLSTGDVATPEVRVVSENRNFTILGPLNQPHMVLRGSPPPPLPIDYTVLSNSLVQVHSNLTFSTLIPALDPPPAEPYLNTEFFIGIETNDPICFRVPPQFLAVPIDESTDPTEQARLSNKFGPERIGLCTAGRWKCAKIELGDGFTFEAEILMDGFESGDISSWSTGAAADNSSRTDKEGAVGILTTDKKLPVLTEEDLKKAIELFNDDTVFDEKTIGLVSERFGILEPLPPATGSYFFDSFESFRSIGAPVGPTLDGTGCPAPCSGLVLEGGGGGINGIRVEGFPTYGAEIRSDGNSITKTEMVSNGAGGLLISGSNNVVGGTTKDGNLFADNGGSGIVVESGTGNSVLSAKGTKGVSRYNRFSNNGALGIDLGGDGVTSNDSGDGDSGANNLQNFPELTNVTTGAQTRISGSLNSTPNGSFTLQFFASEVCDGSGSGEGAVFLDSILMATDGSGQANFSLTSDSSTNIGQVITATATDENGNTSEFSSCFAITASFNPAWLFGAGDLSRTEGTTFDGVALTNFSESAAADLNLEAITASSSEGLLSRSATQGNGGQLTSLTLLAGEQRARLRSEFFEADPTLPAWVEVTGDTSQIGAFSQFGSLDGSQLDGGVAITEVVNQFNFTRVFEGPNAFPGGQAASTRLSVLNPNEGPVTLTLRHHSADQNSEGPQGLFPLQVTRTIQGRSLIDETVSQLFGIELAGGRIEGEVIEGEGVVAFEVIQLTDRDTVLGLNTARGNPNTFAYSAQLASQPGLSTNVNLINTAGETRNLILTAVREDGTTEGSPVPVVLGAGEQFSQRADVLFGQMAEGLSTAGVELNFVGSLIVEADGDGVVGDVIFGDDVDFQYAASLPLQTQVFTEALFNQVANLPGFFTGLAFFYPGAAVPALSQTSPQGGVPSAEITVRVFRANGELAGVSVQILAAGERRSKLLPELVPESAGQAGGYVLISSTEGIIGQMLYGALEGGAIKLFSAVVPTVIQ